MSTETSSTTISNTPAPVATIDVSKVTDIKEASTEQLKVTTPTTTDNTGADSPTKTNSEGEEHGSEGEDGPNKCSHEGCGKTFKSKYSLKRHMLSHLDVKKYQCEYCAKRFVLKQYLKEHTYIHTGEKPYACPFEGCGKSFRQACKLSLHKKNHKLELYQKEIEEKLEALAALKKSQSEQMEASKNQMVQILPAGFQLAPNMVIQTLPNGQQIQYIATNAPGFMQNFGMQDNGTSTVGSQGPQFSQQMPGVMGGQGSSIPAMNGHTMMTQNAQNVAMFQNPALMQGQMTASTPSFGNMTMNGRPMFNNNQMGNLPGFR
eukprot:CAMPEP_0114984026 /NCGR_PEP_ID=MMETSP0216-20121206/7039_1 /TAXON_ID=223996 /ORGANISM="Protocruzia adherens, Strain Boccale" /LENGTH=317 /DNA_ID=CAMNT_0002346099 /DNA_START=156 /DNA_END=1109 /DNA_ORIENTATION=+